MKKFFRIKKQMIPKYLYIQLVLSIALVVFEFVNIFIYLCFKDKHFFGMLLMIHVVLILIDSICFLVLSSIYKKS